MYKKLGANYWSKTVSKNLIGTIWKDWYAQEKGKNSLQNIFFVDVSRLAHNKSYSNYICWSLHYSTLIFINLGVCVFIYIQLQIDPWFFTASYGLNLLFKECLYNCFLLIFWSFKLFKNFLGGRGFFQNTYTNNGEDNIYYLK